LLVAALEEKEPKRFATWFHAQEVLESDHYGLEKIKERILEFPLPFASW